eukprot:TRINITY_DN22519_c0_g1_i1.p1 TRINITY_DN22519_c0_g1~~TRINITY_DN22519_c0_g1_i1.p1  ORF type:complete len:152 (-),score=14.72 TRINITY_DN22519_c0_g1_i1:9-464(-)
MCIRDRKCSEHQLGDKEVWRPSAKKCMKVARTFGKKKFAVVKIGAGSPGYSLRYISLYYALKGLKLLPTKAAQSLNEKMLESLSKVLRDHCEHLQTRINSKSCYDITGVEIVLNEVLVSLNCLKHLLHLSLIHICRCRRYAVCRSRWSPYH